MDLSNNHVCVTSCVLVCVSACARAGLYSRACVWVCFQFLNEEHSALPKRKKITTWNLTEAQKRFCDVIYLQIPESEKKIVFWDDSTHINKYNGNKLVIDQRRLRSACSSMQSDHRLCRAPCRQPKIQSAFRWTANAQADQSLPDAHAIL